MTLPFILVTDTNIWIDLENGGILADVFHLPYQFVIPDFAMTELVRPQWDALAVMGLTAQELDPTAVSELFTLRQVHRSLSVTDLSAFLLARMLKATLLTGERQLSELARANSLSVHGVLWLLDEMVRCQAISPKRAANALGRMLDQGARLPANECKKRLGDWSQ